MQRTVLIFSVLAVLFAISGCAGLHMTPPQDYSKLVAQGAFRVALDQHGLLYPESPPVKMPPEPRVNFNTAFTIAEHMAQSEVKYSWPESDQRSSVVANSLNAIVEASSTKTLVVYIHGYNNSFGSASQSIAAMRTRVERVAGAPLPALEVYWDGLHKGPLTIPIPLYYWFDALTYSNRAGQGGLRSVLNKLTPGTRLLFVTHSRGAGVAFSAVSDPTYNACIAQPPVVTFDRSRFSSIRFVSLAPAVGSGHDLVALQQVIGSNGKVAIGFNKDDPALLKGPVNDPSRLGDTGLGAVDAYFERVRTVVNSRTPNWLIREDFSGMKRHDLDDYLNRQDGLLFDCLVQAALERPPSSGCRSQR